jgi:hypothetical protein
VTASTARILVAALCVALLWGYAAHRSAAKWQAQAIKIQSILSSERAAAEQAKADAESDYRSKAHAADVSFQAGLAAGSNSLAAYIADHRLQSPAKANPASPGQGGDSNIPAIPTTEAVLASLNDLRVCDMNYTYAQAAYDWAQGLNTKD